VGDEELNNLGQVLEVKSEFTELELVLFRDGDEEVVLCGEVD
jgi:hypothetical protein